MSIDPKDIVVAHFDSQARLASVAAQAEVMNWCEAQKELTSAEEQLWPHHVEQKVAEIVGDVLRGYGLPERYQKKIYDDCLEVAGHYIEQPFEEDPNERLETIMSKAEQVVNALLEQGSEAEIEYDKVSVDSMPHTTWMIRAVNSKPTQYLAKDVAHTPELARKQAHAKSKILGLLVTRETDRSKGRANP